MVSCPFNGKEGSKCSVTARRWTRVTLLALGLRPSLGWRSWRCYSSLIMTLDDIGGLAGPISCPPILGVVHTSDGRRNMRRFVYFRTDAHTWLGVTRYFICIYMSFPLLPFFFFFFLTLGALFCIDGSLVACPSLLGPLTYLLTMLWWLIEPIFSSILVNFISLCMSLAIVWTMMT